MERTCTIAVYVHVYNIIICTWRHIADVSIHPGCRLCGAYAVAVGVMTHELVVACSAWALYLRVDVITRRKGVCTYAWVRCRYGI